MAWRTPRELRLTLHALLQIEERGLLVAEVRTVIQTGVVIEEYPDDTPFPSMLILGCAGSTPVHVALAYDRETDGSHIVTAYRPDPEKWDRSFKKRKR